ncbi:MAG: imidazole glycerol phosphate synthase subunit HisH [Pseudomonadota bacterium]
MSGEVTAIVDYDSGNLHSAEKAVQRMAAPLGQTVIVTADPDAVARADRIVLPGVGAFGDCAAGLAAIPGMTEALETRVRRDGRPFLGVCVGAQLMAREGDERGMHDGLGWIDGLVTAITPRDPALKIPHMGWNKLSFRPRARGAHPVLDGLGPEPYAYFVHSYHMRPTDPSVILAEAEYGGPITAIFGRDSMIGCQFHPEKSQVLGLSLIDRFLRWRP